MTATPGMGLAIFRGHASCEAVTAPHWHAIVVDGRSPSEVRPARYAKAAFHDPERGLFEHITIKVYAADGDDTPKETNG